jgi:hypothetical protein
VKLVVTSVPVVLVISLRRAISRKEMPQQCEIGRSLTVNAPCAPLAFSLSDHDTPLPKLMS